MSENRVSDERLEWMCDKVGKAAMMREGVARQEWLDLAAAIEELQGWRRCSATGRLACVQVALL